MVTEGEEEDASLAARWSIQLQIEDWSLPPILNIVYPAHVIFRLIQAFEAIPLVDQNFTTAFWRKAWLWSCRYKVVLEDPCLNLAAKLLRVCLCPHSATQCLARIQPQGSHAHCKHHTKRVLYESYDWNPGLGCNGRVTSLLKKNQELWSWRDTANFVSTIRATTRLLMSCRAGFRARILRAHALPPPVRPPLLAIFSFSSTFHHRCPCFPHGPSNLK